MTTEFKPNVLPSNRPPTADYDDRAKCGIDDSDEPEPSVTDCMNAIARIVNENWPELSAILTFAVERHESLAAASDAQEIRRELGDALKKWKAATEEFLRSVERQS